MMSFAQKEPRDQALFVLCYKRTLCVVGGKNQVLFSKTSIWPNRNDYFYKNLVYVIFLIQIVTSVLPAGPTEVTVHICANNKAFGLKIQINLIFITQILVYFKYFS